MSPPELVETAKLPAAAAQRFPWRTAFRSPGLLAMLVTTFCYLHAYSFFQNWLPTFLVKGRELSEGGLLFSALPYVLAACANLGGGAANDALAPMAALLFLGAFLWLKIDASEELRAEPEAAAAALRA